MENGGTEGAPRGDGPSLKKRATSPASTADPKNAEKIDFDSYQIFVHLWLRLLDAVLMNTMFIVRN
jgi:hypothetical protein